MKDWEEAKVNDLLEHIEQGLKNPGRHAPVTFPNTWWARLWNRITRRRR